MRLSLKSVASLARHAFGEITSPQLWSAVGLLFLLSMAIAQAWMWTQSRRIMTLAVGSSFPAPAGALLDGTSSGVRHGSPSRCFVVRFEARSCSFCERDAVFFDQIVEEAALRGCDVFVMAPTPSEVPAPRSDGRITLAYSSVAFASGAGLLVTPTEVLVDASGRVAWSKIGAMSPEDLEAARAVLPTISSNTTVVR